MLFVDNMSVLILLVITEFHLL